MNKFRLTLIFIFFIFLLSSCSITKEIEVKNKINKSQNETIEKMKILAFGDSLTAGYRLERKDSYPMQLEKYLKENGYKNIEVMNAGISGETTTAALERTDWLLKSKPDIIILETGANDALRGIDLNLTKNNIDKIIKKIKNKNITLILAGMQIVENLGPKYTKEFERIFPELAKKHKIILIEQFLEHVAANSSLNLEDEIHPNKEGYKIIVEENIYPHLKKILDEK